LGELEILGVLHRLVAPTGVAGVVELPASTGPFTREVPILVGYGDLLVRLGALHTHATGSVADEASCNGADPSELVFAAPLSGRFYARPAPDKPLFVRAGDEIETGKTVGLLEVMKTFNRIAYGGPGLPARATIRRVVPADGDDVEAGSPLLVVEPAP
jgi:acetyl-CoA carboxylase biotin carboxyl carrier protein